MSRSYLTFGSDDKINWSRLDSVLASGSAQALNLAREQENHRHYAVVPERNWTAATPQVKERAPVVHWEDLTPGQMQIDHGAPREEEKKTGKIEEKIEEARSAL